MQSELGITQRWRLYVNISVSYSVEPVINFPAPALRVATQIGPYFVVVLDGGPATAFGLRRVWADFRSQRRARESK